MPGAIRKSAEKQGRWSFSTLLKAFLNRPYLVTAGLFGLGIYFAMGPWVPRGITRVLIGWDCGVVIFLGLIYLFLRHADSEEIKRRAAEYDEGGRLVLVITILASIASVGALVAELSGAKGQVAGGIRIALAASTVILSWLLVHVAFALRYAHIYYLAQRSGRSGGGLMFGDEGEPDYWDFVHFSLVIGATSQTADVAFSSREMRRLGTLHTLVAFGFNTAILATMINLAASLF
ncbi:MAG TPA: DUF1345 domain-containing protein [Rhizomicrobium sp.]|nr:DUF1345 domain-containing protein [Rhizomicrobium sp.]